MAARKTFTMSEEDYKALLEASKPTPVMYLSGGMSMFRTAQENANEAWQRLGEKMGFVWDSVRPIGTDPKQFTAEPKIEEGGEA